MYHHLLRREDFACKNFISNTSRIEVAHSYAPIISIIPCSSMQKNVCPSYLCCSFNKRGSLELWEKFIELSRSIKVIQIHDIVSITGSRAAEFN